MKVKKFFLTLLAVVLSLSYLVTTSQLAYGAFENFLEWTEVDGSDDVTISQYSTQWIDEPRSAVNYVYDDLGADYLDTSFQVTFQAIDNGSTVGTSGSAFWVVSNVLGSETALDNADEDYLAFYPSHPSTPNEVRWSLKERVGVDKYDTSASSYFVPTNSTTYHITITRDETIGTYGQLQVTIYDDYMGGNDVANLTHNLHQKSDFRYIYSHQSVGAAGAFYCSGLTSYMELTSSVSAEVPVVLTYQVFNAVQGAIFQGYASDDNGEILSSGFDLGEISDNYTLVFPSTNEGTSIVALATTDNLTYGSTYFLRAFATNSNGTGYGEEVSFTFSPQSYRITISEATVIQTVSGNFSAGFNVEIDPPTISNNVSAYLSPDFPPYTNNIPLYLLYVNNGVYTFSTWNGTYGTTSTLLPETTYYYQSKMVLEDETSAFSEIKSFTTDVPIIPTKPTVLITKLTDVSLTYGEDYVVEAIGQVTTSNTTDHIINQGFKFSMSALSDGTLLPNIEKYLALTRNPDGTFELTFSLNNTDWYNGEKLYFVAFVTTPYHGEVASVTVPFTFTDETDIPDVPGEDTTVTGISDLILRIRANLGLVGTMGTWAFMGLVILIISLLFGTAFVSVQESTGKTALGFTWLLAVVSVVGAFIFTGELGIWPILILVGGLVVLIIIILSMKLSGSEV